MGAKYFQEFGPKFLACHVPDLACHGVSTSCVSMSSVSCRVIILRVSMSVPCRGHPAAWSLMFPDAQILIILFNSPNLYFFVEFWSLHGPLGGQERFENDPEPHGSVPV